MLGPSYRGYVYLIGSSRFGWYKIGQSKTAEIRIKQLGILLPFKIEVFSVWMTDNPSRLESSFHQHYSDFHINGEWFSFEWNQLGEVIADDPPYFGQRVFQKESDSLYQFSNLRDDKYIETSKALKKQKHEALWEAMKEIISNRGLEHTRENRDAVRNEILSKQNKELVLLSAIRKCQVEARTSIKTRLVSGHPKNS